MNPEYTCPRFRIALRKVFPFCSRPLLGALQTLLGQESSSNYSLGDIQLHLTINAKKRAAGRRATKKTEPLQMLAVEGSRGSEYRDIIEEKEDTGEMEASLSLTLDELA